ncbi:hypothetical protein CDD81_648 [Ophiocordyceps australis]|uniref:Uncharacterized protein n=1 Tax=Ophiocordyceps australis TaxID=1399860 RepID=A0A2C5Y1H9_9HYPO|nr:hypothetical protein CDD81_648 [Ophiocordyceps australis]
MCDIDLRPVHSLPTTEDASQGRFGSTADYDVDHLKDEIAILRVDLKLNIIKQRAINIDQVTENDVTLQRLQVDLQTLLKELDRLVDSTVLDVPKLGRTRDDESLASFPRLVALRRLLQSQDDAEPEGFPDCFHLPDGANISAMAESKMTSAYTASKARFLQPTTAQVASFIHFPRDAAKMASCRRAISRFGMSLDDLKNSECCSTLEAHQMLDCTPQDVQVIQHAHEFASACTSLFFQMVDGTKCGTPHQAKLHLSGFKEDQVRMNIDRCQDTAWVPTVFTHSLKQPLLEPFYFDHICSPVKLHPPEESEMLHVAFNSDGLWTLNQGGMEFDQSIEFGKGKEELLDHLLNSRHSDTLTPKYRKLAGALLAASLFQLSDSPWIEPHLGPECILVPVPDNAHLQQWCPRVLCSLMPQKSAKTQSDNVAAFGVLVLELEANRKAHWTTDDEEWLTGEKSNHVRLARILEAWKDYVYDEPRKVAKACLEFDSLISSLDHPDIVSENKGLAVMYKCILQPLHRHVTKSFGNLAPLFKGMFGPGRSLSAFTNISPSVTAKRVFFDDDDSLPKSKDQDSASKFLKSLEPFLSKIRDLHENSISLTQQFMSIGNRIRIAVLDSGVDDINPMIRSAIKAKRINSQESKNFVDCLEDWNQDTYGHGTHITRLLLQTAPSAEIYVGKICTRQFINDEFMPGIAQAINWAVYKCDAHIISISFGFEEKNDLIDEALDKAIKGGKIIMAAASNNGGLSGRTKPACQGGVICVHATDGNGNKGAMNPSPLPDTDNFATLGVAVPSRWGGKDVWKSGTSFAVPIAVGFAANILELARVKCSVSAQKKLGIPHRQGMQAVFRKMSEKRDGYDFIHPVRLCRDWQDEQAEQQAAKAIEDIVEDL